MYEKVTKSPTRAAVQSPKVRKTTLDTFFEGKAYQQSIQWILFVMVFAVYITCLVLYLTNYSAVQDAVEAHFDYTSGFVYNPWFVILMLTFSMLGLLYIVNNLTSYILPIIFLFVVFFAFFILTFIFIYNKEPTQQSATPQIMASIAFISLTLVTLFIIPYAKRPFFTFLCLVPTYFLVIMSVYVGGVMNRTWIA